jgi:hypothetical protein
MSKVTVPFASFVLGVLTTLAWLFGSHSSIRAQEPPPQAPPSAQAPQSLPLLAGGAGVPAVPPITQHFEDFGIVGMSGAFGVDGIECTRCKFSGPVLRYGGGNFQLTDFRFSGPVRVELIGAAANTVLFLNFVQSLSVGQVPPKPTIPKPPMIKTVAVKETVAGSFGTDN